MKRPEYTFGGAAIIVCLVILHLLLWSPKLAIGDPWGRTGRDQFVLKTGDTMTGALILPVGSESAPSLGFGSGGDTGWFENNNGVLYFTGNGANAFYIYSAEFAGYTAGAGMIRNTTSSSTIPTICPGRGDENSGIGLAGLDSLSIIAGSVEGIRIAEGAGSIVISVAGGINYAADAEANDVYEVAIPTIVSLAAGLTVTFKANTANSGTATLTITSVGDVDVIYKLHDQPLVTGDIEAGQIVVVVFDGDDWQMTSQLAQ